MNRWIDTSFEIDGRHFWVEIGWEDSEFADELAPPNPQQVTIEEEPTAGEPLTDEQLGRLTTLIKEWAVFLSDRIPDGCWFGPRIDEDIVRKSLGS